MLMNTIKNLMILIILKCKKIINKMYIVLNICDIICINLFYMGWSNMFELVSKYNPSGDQLQAIEELVNGINNGDKHQVLLGATGTGKTLR